MRTEAGPSIPGISALSGASGGRRRLVRVGAVGGRRTALDADGHDAILAHRFDPHLVPVGDEAIAALGPPAELREHIAADRIEGVGGNRKADADVLEVAGGPVAPHVPVAVR